MTNLVCVYMEQAVAGPMKDYAFYSGQFSSCSPLFAFNIDTKNGAYYHVPGKNGSGKHDGDRPICSAIVQAIQPTHIWVFPPGDNKYLEHNDYRFGAQISGNDQDGLARMLGAVAIAHNTDYMIIGSNVARMGLAVRLNNGFPQFLTQKGQSYDQVFDPKVSKVVPPSCLVWNWNIDLSNWMRLS